MNAGDFVPYISPIVTFIIGIVTVIMTRNNLVASQKYQEILNSKRINADIITKSRIEWIQDVRNQAAATLESFAKYMDAHNSNDRNNAFVSYYNYAKQLDTLRLYFPKENLQVNYDFKLNYLRQNWELNVDFSNLPKDSPTLILFKEMINPSSNANRNNYINDYAKQLKYIELSLDTIDSAHRQGASSQEIARNLSANQYYLNLLIDVISNYLKLEWEVAKKFEPI